MQSSIKTKLFLLSLVLLVCNGLSATETLDIPPRPINTPSPSFFGKIVTSDAYVSLSIEIDAQGNVSNAIVRYSSHHTLEKATLQAFRKWEYEPAYRNGKPVPCKIVQPLTFGSSLLSTIDEKAMALYSPKPELAKKLQEVEGEVGVAVSVDSAGFVTRVKVLYSSDQRLNLPVLKAIRNWQFEPAKRNGRAISSKIIQPFVFGVNTKYKDNQVINAAAASISINPIKQIPVALAQTSKEDE
jgi:TonB family protein